MKRMLILLLALVCLFVSLSSAASGEGARFVTVREWLDARGECGDCMLLVRIMLVLNPVLAVAEDETGTVNLFSGNGETSMIINFMPEGGPVMDGYTLVIANPRWNEYEGTVEMADWTVLSMLAPDAGKNN